MKKEMKDGYGTRTDGYNYDNQINVRLNDEDIIDLKDINEYFFEGELSSSMLGRILIRKGIKYYKQLK